MLAVFVVSSCGGIKEQGDAGSKKDQLVADLAIKDQAIPDKKAADKSAADQTIPDKKVVDKSAADQTIPDKKVIDLSAPDLTVVVFEEVHSGYQHTCARKSDGAIVCWGLNTKKQATNPVGKFLSFDSGANVNCGIKTDQSIHCWGSNEHKAVSARPTSGYFKQIACGGYHCCALDAVGYMNCWGSNTYKEGTAQPGTFTAISAGSNSNCAIQSTGKTICWGHGTKLTPAPSDTFSKISTDWGSSACGIVQSSNKLVCWGHGTTSTNCKPNAGGIECGQAVAPSGTFEDVSSGAWHACGVQQGGKVVCWGYGKSSATCNPNGSGANIHSCGQALPPAGTFKSVDVAKYHSCGVVSGGTIKCWGWNKYGQAKAPAP